MIRTLLLFCTTLVVAGPVSGQIYFEDFTTDANYTTSVPVFTDNANDYFLRTNGSNISPQLNFVGADGFFFAAQDIDEGTAAPLPLLLDVTGIDITGQSNLEFSGMFAEDQAVNAWDAGDYVKVLYQIDSGGYENLFWIRYQGFDSSPARVDNDFDGQGEGDLITSTFTKFTRPIVGTGSTLDLRVEFNLDAGDEDIAFDNFRIGQAVATPEPGCCGLLAMMLLLAGGRRRRV